MKNNFEKRGVLITFEGVDGCGKSTQLECAHKYLVEKGHEVHKFREPGSTKAGERIRELLLDKDLPLDPKTQLFLFEAARAQMVEKELKPLLKKRCVILCDRYFDSTTAYQGYGGKMDQEMIDSLNRWAVGPAIPDLTFIFILPLSSARPRVREQLALRLSDFAQVRGEINRLDDDKDRIELRSERFFNDVATGFQKIALANLQRVKTIDARPSIEEVFQSVETVLDSFFETHRLL